MRRAAAALALTASLVLSACGPMGCGGEDDDIVQTSEECDD